MGEVGTNCLWVKEDVIWKPGQMTRVLGVLPLLYINTGNPDKLEVSM